MKIAYLLKISDTAKSRLDYTLKGMRDNIQTFYFENVSDMISYSKKRNITFDRIVIIGSTLNSKDTLKSLYNYWEHTSNNTQIILIAKTGVDDNKIKEFLNTFTTPLVAVISVDSTSIQIFGETVKMSVEEINAKYGVASDANIEINDGFDYIPDIEEPEDIKVEEPETVTAPVVTPTPAEKKSSVFDKLKGMFGGKSKPSKIDGDTTPQGTIENVPIEESEVVGVIADETNNNPTIDYEKSVDTEVTDDWDNLETPENPEVNSEEKINLQDSEDEPNNSENTDNTEISELNVDDDLGDFTISFDVNKDGENGLVVEDTMEGIGNIASEEHSYRETKEQPKVIVKEVIKNIDKNYTALTGVVSGRNKKVIVVTGDRGTGVTSTALALANEMARKVKVLYVDFDTQTHGLLSYIDYDTFRTYGERVLAGVRYCKSNKVFDSCVMSYEHNFDILTSDYSCDITDEEIEAAQGVVTEVADKYNVVVVDCPLSKLSKITDLILLGNTILCVEESKRGFMNMLCLLEDSTLSDRYKKLIISRGNMFLTKCLKTTDTKKLLKYINTIYEADTAINWMRMEIVKFNGKFSDSTLNKIFES